MNGVGNGKGLTADLRGDLKASILQRIERNMTLTITREMDAGTGDEFSGLYRFCLSFCGVVWRSGDMNSFQSIAESKNTSLAVAPGIAEALFATALGLLAAIPAVAAYNKFSGDLDKVSSALEVFAQEFTTALGRQLDEEASKHGGGLEQSKRWMSRRRARPMSEINVTPFVDVMLVLLIVFMVTAPLLIAGVPVDLPKTKAGQINADQAPGCDHQ